MEKTTEDITTVRIDLPHGIKGSCRSNKDGSYTIILNTRYSCEEQIETYMHELRYRQNFCIITWKYFLSFFVVQHIKKTFSSKEYNFIVKSCFYKMHNSGYNYGYQLCTLQYCDYFRGYNVLINKTIENDKDRLKYINNYTIFFLGNENIEDIMIHPRYLSANERYLFKKLLRKR